MSLYPPTKHSFQHVSHSVMVILKFRQHLSQLMRLWYLSHRWPAKAQALQFKMRHNSDKFKKCWFPNVNFEKVGWWGLGRHLHVLNRDIYRNKYDTYSYSYMSSSMIKQTTWSVCPAKTDQPGHMPMIRLRCLLGETLRSLSILTVHREDFDQTGWMPRLIWVFTERTSYCWFRHASAQITIYCKISG